VNDDPIESWRAAIAPLDDLLRPIGSRKVDLTDPDWARKFPSPRQNPLDEAGIRPQAESLLGQVVERYPAMDEATRQRVRELFHEFRYFTWATTLGYRPTDAASLAAAQRWAPR
jgi:hypothetical protein